MPKITYLSIAVTTNVFVELPSSNIPVKKGQVPKIRLILAKRNEALELDSVKISFSYLYLLHKVLMFTQQWLDIGSSSGGINFHGAQYKN